MSVGVDDIYVYVARLSELLAPVKMRNFHDYI